MHGVARGLSFFLSQQQQQQHPSNQTLCVCAVERETTARAICSTNNNVTWIETTQTHTDTGKKIFSKKIVKGCRTRAEKEGVSVRKYIPPPPIFMFFSYIPMRFSFLPLFSAWFSNGTERRYRFGVTRFAVRYMAVRALMIQDPEPIVVSVHSGGKRMSYLSSLSLLVQRLRLLLAAVQKTQ